MRNENDSQSPWDLLLLVPPGLMLLALLWPLATGEIYAGSDLRSMHLPFRAFYAESLARGELPLWDPNLFCGFPLLAQGELGACHPLHLLLYRLFPLWLALTLEVCASYLFAFAGMFLFLRSLSLRRATVLFGAGAFAFSFFLLAHYPHVNHVATFAHLPWLLWTSRRIIVPGDRPRRGPMTIGLALTLASLILLGHPPTAWRVLLGTAVFALYALLRHRGSHLLIAHNGTGPDAQAPPAKDALCAISRCDPLLLLGVGVAGGLVLSAVQWLPTLAYVARSDLAAPPVEFVNAYSLHPWNLLQLAAPHVFAHGAIADGNLDSTIEYALGIGTGLLLLSLLAYAPKAEDKRWPVLPLAGAAVVGLWLALGRYGLLHGVTAHLPVLRSFRCPARYVSLFHLGLLGLALVAVERALAGGLERRRTIIVGTGLAAAAWVIYAAAGAGLTPDAASRGALALSALGVALVCAAGVMGLWRGGGWTRAFLCLCLLETGLYGYQTYLAGAERLGIKALGEALAGRATAPGQYRIMGLWNAGVLEGRRNVSGYCSLAPRPAVETLTPGQARRLAVDLALIDGQEFRTPNPLPRIRLDDGAAGQVEVIEDAPQRLVIDVATEGPAKLIVADRWDPDWECLVNGQYTGVAREYGFVRAVQLEAGRHRVEFRYTPQFFYLGAMISSIGCIIILIAWLAIRRRARSAEEKIP